MPYYDFELQFEPLTKWPLPDTNPRRNPVFRTTYDKTLRQLKSELAMLDAKGAVAIQIVTKNGHADLRRDGMLMARAQVTHPGVRISFMSKHGSLTYSSDAFESMYYNDAPDWQANLRAIVLGLEALRAVDRYGISGSGEQYRGWQQIAARTSDSSGMSRDVATAVLVEESGLPVDLDNASPEALKLIVRTAQRKAHPDTNNGDQSRWNALTEALRALGMED